MFRTLLAVILLGLAQSALAQTNPCTTTATTVAYAPTKVVLQVDDYGAQFTSSAGTMVPLWDVIEFGVLPASTPSAVPTVSFTAARGTLTLVAGTTNCYVGTPAQLIALPAATPQVIVARKVRTSTEPMTTSWSAPSNPFADLPALLPPGAVRVTK